MMPLRSICVHFIFMMIGINFSYICPNGGEKKPAMFCIAGQGIQIGRDLSTTIIAQRCDSKMTSHPCYGCAYSQA